MDGDGGRQAEVRFDKLLGAFGRSVQRLILALTLPDRRNFELSTLLTL